MDDKALDVQVQMIERRLPRPVAEKIDMDCERVDATEQVEVDAETLVTVKRLLQSVVNEESTDVVIDSLASLMPWGTGWAARRVLDRLLPEALLGVLFRLLDRVAT